MQHHADGADRIPMHADQNVHPRRDSWEDHGLKIGNDACRCVLKSLSPRWSDQVAASPLADLIRAKLSRGLDLVQPLQAADAGSARSARFGQTPACVIRPMCIRAANVTPRSFSAASRISPSPCPVGGTSAQPVKRSSRFQVDCRRRSKCAAAAGLHTPAPGEISACPADWLHSAV